MWMDAIRDKMKVVRAKAMEEHQGDLKELEEAGYCEIGGHLIFNVKLGENFRRKARYVAEGYKAKTPSSVTYSSVVKRDSIRILLLIAALNELDVKGANVKNALLTAPYKERSWLRAGTEFMDEQGKIFIVVRALYGLKSASASFRAFMAEYLHELGYTSCYANNNVWMRPASKEDRFKYYKYIVCYVYDILAISHQAHDTLIQLGKMPQIKFNGDKIEIPDMYLGSKLVKKVINGHACWLIDMCDYLKAAVTTIKDLESTYSPELDGLPELDADDVRRYQEIIGMFRWSTENGRVDVLHEVSILSQYMAILREGHMKQLLRIVAFIDNNPKLSLCMDPDWQ